MKRLGFKGQSIEATVLANPAGQAGGIETVVRALVQFVALTLSEKPEETIKLLREAALDGLNATKLEGLSPEQQNDVFAAARTTISLVLDVSLSEPANRPGTY